MEEAPGAHKPEQRGEASGSILGLPQGRMHGPGSGREGCMPQQEQLSERPRLQDT